MRANVPHDQVVVGTICNELLAMILQSLIQSLEDDLHRVGLEVISLDFLKLNGEGSNVGVVRATLKHWGHSKVNGFFEYLTEEDHARAGVSKTLVRSDCNNISKLEGIREQLSNDIARGVCYFSHEEGTDLVANLTETFVALVTGGA